jgi:hypothetical protein
MPVPDPDEKFTLAPLEGEDVLKRLLEGAGTDGDEEVSGEPEDEEPES